MRKKEITRRKLLEIRSSIPKAEYLQKSAQICGRLMELEAFQKAQVIHCYVSMNDRREVNTHPLIKEMLQAGKKVVVPFTQMETGMLKHVGLTSFDSLQKNTWGVLEPTSGNEVSAEELELVIIPMAGGDRHKNRIGYGKGFYDRFLKHVNSSKIGLLFEACLTDIIPTEPFDVPLDMLITEKQIIR